MQPKWIEFPRVAVELRVIRISCGLQRFNDLVTHDRVVNDWRGAVHEVITSKCTTGGAQAATTPYWGEGRNGSVPLTSHEPWITYNH